MAPRLTCDRPRLSTVTKRQEKNTVYSKISNTCTSHSLSKHHYSVMRAKTNTAALQHIPWSSTPCKILVPSAALRVGSRNRAGGRANITSHLWLYMSASVGDVVHQEVLRQRRLGYDRHLVVEGHQVARQLPVVRSVGLVQDLSKVRQRVTSRNHRAGSGVPDGTCRVSPGAVKVGLAAIRQNGTVEEKHRHRSTIPARLDRSRATRGKPHTYCLQSEKSYRALLGNR